jgi:hypothetical protein
VRVGFGRSRVSLPGRDVTNVWLAIRSFARAACCGHARSAQTRAMSAEPSNQDTRRLSPTVVRLESAGDRHAPRATADVRVSIGGESFHLQLTVPDGPADVGGVVARVSGSH